MDWKARFFELLDLVKRFLKRQATIGELRSGVRRLEQSAQDDDNNKS